MYLVKLEAFEGPLDLLLHLIHRLEIDIYDIPVSEITEQYMEYIHTMQELELDVASEYLVMAATLLSIKSKMLLPRQEEEWSDEEIIEEEQSDPRDELVTRLIEYKKYKEAAVKLKELESERALVYTKPPSDLSEYLEEKEPILQKGNVTVYDMIAAFQKMLKRKKIEKPIERTVAKEEIPIEKRMKEMIMELKASKKKKEFHDFFPADRKDYMVVTFLALLQLMKNEYVHVEQEHNFSEIYIYGSEKLHEFRDY
ncbi:MAG: segregation/condensation protein A [Bacillaceae bacterium]|jgi:Uncharacterized conserved protein|uniref:Segregation and condensation protein A n=2 Tax=Aeribacillus TaxID=1055323 RepID=A0A165XDD7_9BACI|nr:MULTISPECIES: segregation/condensation protein A [Aeribacillus]AXI40068.1 segregation/condensation protein A [Bacillaceae bacterium ZC4]REJ17530.1 MAG: segregation/condensation protein A [Bacillaceae bacterium]ASS91789.1 segregation/condensation protein A [Aeribacillus pallidus]KZM56911.1 segregation/condensation protein A [Aeribacillus pallidus]KZN95900.1 segregation/condensation protein A [Aeribacillus pallidus]